MKKKMRFLAILILAGISLFVVAGCGGGDDGTIELCFEEWDDWTRTSPASAPTSGDLQGAYDLVGFLLNYYMDGELILSMDQNDVFSYSGEMDIGTTDVYQSITIEGENVTVNATYTNSPSDSVSGILHINQSGMEYDVEYSISDGIMTTYSGLICEDIPESVLMSLALEENTFGALLGPGLYY